MKRLSILFGGLIILMSACKKEEESLYSGEFLVSVKDGWNGDPVPNAIVEVLTREGSGVFDFEVEKTLLTNSGGNLSLSKNDNAFKYLNAKADGFGMFSWWCYEIIDFADAIGNFDPEYMHPRYGSTYELALPRRCEIQINLVDVGQANVIRDESFRAPETETYVIGDSFANGVSIHSNTLVKVEARNSTLNATVYYYDETLSESVSVDIQTELSSEELNVVTINY